MYTMYRLLTPNVFSLSKMRLGDLIEVFKQFEMHLKTWTAEDISHRGPHTELGVTG